MSKYIGFFASLMMAFNVSAATFKIDQEHSNVAFKVRHLIGKVRGSFGKFSGTYEFEKGKPKAWKTKAEIDVKSIDTKTAKRDDHLRGKDFFWAEKHPKITFESTKITKFRKGKGKLHGKLTMRGVTKDVVLDLELSGVAQDPWGNTKSAFFASTKINRKDFGLNWNEALETGGVLVGEEVEIMLEIEGTQVEEKKKAKK